MKLRNIAFTVLMSLLSASAAAAELPWLDGSWPHERSDVQADSRVLFGRLPNGFRYAVIPNANPAGRVSLWLDVQAGSWMEEPHEGGIAHFLEHMAFNGSENFAPGELISFFQKNGMSFGGDTNAHTSALETVYKLNLADNTPDSLDKAAGVLYDMAAKLTLSPQEIDRERGVIFSEKRARDSEAAAAGRQWRQFLYGDTRFARDTIGTEDTLNRINAADMRAFYEKWYHPARMILVIAGDVASANAEETVKKVFSRLPAPDTLPFVPSFGAVEREGIRALIQKRPVSSVTYTLMTQHPPRHENDTRARHRDRFTDSVISMALARRLLARRTESPDLWSAAVFRASWQSSHTPAVIMTATANGTDWKKAAEGLQTEWLRAQQYGLTQEELNGLKADLGKMLERAVEQESQYTNEDYAKAFVSTVNADRVFTSASDDLKLYRECRDTLTPEAVNARLQAMLSPENRRILLSGNVTATADEVIGHWNAMKALSVTPPLIADTLTFPYLPLPEEVRYTPVLTPYGLAGAETTGVSASALTLPGGTRAVFLKTPFEKGKVSAVFSFGEGLLPLSDTEAAEARMAVTVLREQKVGRMTPLDAVRQFGARGLSVEESISEHSQSISGQARSEDVALLLQAMWTQFKDPTLTEQNRNRVIEQIAQGSYQRNKTVNGISKTERVSFFTGSRAHTRPLEADSAKAVSLSGMQTRLEQSRHTGQRVLIVSGDFDEAAAAREVRRLFDEPAADRKQTARQLPKPVFPAGADHTVTVSGDRTGKAVVCLAFHSDLPEITDRRALLTRSLLASVVRDRMRLKLREELAVSYSPFAVYRHAEHDDGFGFLLMEVETNRQQVEKTREALLSIAQDIVKNGVSDEELQRQKKPALTSWTTGRKKSAVWAQRVRSELLFDRPYVSWSDQTGELLHSITAAEVTDAAKTVFNGETARLTVVSGG